MKRYKQLKVLVWLIPIALFTLGTLSAQERLKENLFRDYESLIDSIRKDNGELLSPENFDKAIEHFRKANELYEEKEGKIVKIRKELNKSREYALKAQEIIRLANLTFQKTLEAREAALNAQAPLHVHELWEKAESKFYDAARNLEEDDMEDAREDGKEALKRYKNVELKAIKVGILGEAREQIAKAEEVEADEYCYRTLMSAKNLLNEAEKQLNQDRYAKDEALAKANDAAYQARHAQYLAKTIKALKREDDNWEKLFLKFEDYLKQISSLFNYEPRFDEGLEPTVLTLVAYVDELKEEKKRLIEDNARLEEELNSIREIEANISAELEAKQRQEEKIETIKELFSKDEAHVVFTGNELVIHLYGLNFQTGKAIIQPEYFSLLTKVERALREFSDYYYIIEGHTDATGNARINKMLSEKRALAVKEYLLANMEIENEQIGHYGMGDQEPIDTNKTSEGRAHNRRIDVIISLD